MKRCNKGVLATALALSCVSVATACSAGGVNNAKKSETAVVSEVAESESVVDTMPVVSEETVLNVGDTWVVDGLWKITVNSVTSTDERNEYEERKPEAVYIIDYTYENLGLESEYSDGLFVDFAMGQIVDNARTMGYSYPGNQTKYPQPTPVGAICEAESVIGVDNAGDFKIVYTMYDNDGNAYKATFNIAVQ